MRGGRPPGPASPVPGLRRTLGLVIAGAALLGACSGDDGPGGGPRPTPGAALAERLGCRSGSFRTASGGGWQEVDVHDCRGEVTARIYGSLTTPQRDAAVRLLAAEAEAEDRGPSTGCSSFGPSQEDLYVVAGDAWVAVVLGEQEARSAARRLDGELRPGSIDTPPWTGAGNDCLPGP